ncbi:MAG: FAD-dependent oxidoreductase [ANME-2 cluster archaeon]|jgi:phytoene dehydrogenase-like protein|nr:FAD-dependent oxidoreductase [ANME-2 cluster archaeon]
MADYDVIVVGGGISGLMSAMTLSKHGKKVLVLEKHSYVGGNCNSYDVNGFQVDTGVHAITHLRVGPLRRLIDTYFDYTPMFLDHGAYHVRTPNGLSKIPSNLKEFATFDVLPKMDRLLLSQSITKAFTQSTLGSDLSNQSVYDYLPGGLSEDSLDFINAMCYSLSGKSMYETSVHRVLAGSGYMRDSVPEKFLENEDIAKSYMALLANHLTVSQLKGHLSILSRLGNNDIGYSQAYPRKGLKAFLNAVLFSMNDSVQIKTSSRVTGINTTQGVVKEVVTPEGTYQADVVVFTGFAKDLPALTDNLPSSYIQDIGRIVQTHSMTIWLGLDTKLPEFDYTGSEVWFKRRAFWAMPISNYDKSLAPPGKQLVGFTFIVDESVPLVKDRKRMYNTILTALPGIEDHIDMTHYQYTIPEKAAVTINGYFADTRTPVTNLYLAGTDTDSRSMGITRAGYSVLGLLKVLREDHHIE